MAKKTRSIVAVELSPAYLKLVEMFPAENRVAAVAIEPLESARWGDDAYLEERIRAAIGRHKRADVSALVTSVSGSHALLRLVEIPRGEDNVLDALHWDMEQYLARPLDDYLMDYQQVDSPDSDSGGVYLVAAYRRSEVERIQRLLESSGFPLVVLDVDVFAALNAFEVNYPDLQSGRSLLIKADSSSVLCVRTQNGLFLEYDLLPVNISTADVEIETQQLLELVRQIKTRFDSVNSVWGVDNVVLCGDWVVHEKFRETLKDSLPRFLTCLDAFKEISFVPGMESGAAFMPMAAQCAGALGLALRRPGEGE
jgi:Tfp pilus assembly PilM family ATPase